jgi:16S rRNA (cytidine1402-2'-O)-methyltransferase
MTLFVVSTPIGNLEDISPRALDTLGRVHTILAEDTRHTRRLLNHFDIHTPLLSYHQHSKLSRLDHILHLLAHHDLALVSDAGTPAISDPGDQLIAAAVAQGVEIVPIPGASAVSLMVAAGGIDMHRFVFLGFLPRKGGKQRELIAAELKRGCPLVVYESPYRLLKTLENLKPLLGRAQLAVGRELTKRFEEFIRGDYNSVVKQLTNTKLKGEIALIISPHQ